MTSKPATSPSNASLLLRWLWWGAFAALTFLALHQLAVSGLPSFTPGTLRNWLIELAPESDWQSYAARGQYFLPSLCLFMGLLFTGLGFLRNKDSKNRSGDALLALGDIDNREFDRLLAEAFRLQGYQVVSSSGSGVDIVLRKDHETCLVLAKQWKVEKVGLQPIRDLFTIMSMRGAASGITVTTGRFSREAVQYASTHGIKLVEGAMLLAMIKRAQSELRGKEFSHTTAAAFVQGKHSLGYTEAVDPMTPQQGSKKSGGWEGSVPAGYIPVADVPRGRAEPDDDEGSYIAVNLTAPPVAAPQVVSAAVHAHVTASMEAVSSPAFAPVLPTLAEFMSTQPIPAAWPAPASATATASSMKMAASEPALIIPPDVSFSPTVPMPLQVDKRCPKCGAGMVLRKVRSGPKAGRSVLSCETYPACRGARRAG